MSSTAKKEPNLAIGNVESQKVFLAVDAQIPSHRSSITQTQHPIESFMQPLILSSTVRHFEVRLDCSRSSGRQRAVAQHLNTKMSYAGTEIGRSPRITVIACFSPKAINLAAGCRPKSTMCFSRKGSFSEYWYLGSENHRPCTVVGLKLAF
jgi:hypothetical protein